MKKKYRTESIYPILLWFIGILVPFLLSVLYLSGWSLVSWISFFLLVFTSSLLILYYLGRGPLWGIYWRSKFSWPDIAVLKEEGAIPHLSDFGPSKWLESIVDLKFRVRCIGVAGISNYYPVLVNPYGEAYPEENAYLKTTFGRIEDYVYNGGIFVSVGGFPFFYALDKKSGNKVPLASK